MSDYLRDYGKLEKEIERLRAAISVCCDYDLRKEADKLDIVLGKKQKELDELVADQKSLKEDLKEMVKKKKKMKLNDQQITEIKKLIPYFEKLKAEDIDQENGETNEYKTVQELRRATTEGRATKEECGLCFGVHLAHFYGVTRVGTNDNGHTCHVYYYADGREWFYKKMGLLGHTIKKEEFLMFMSRCGAGSANVFSSYEWDLHPKDVLKNMLEKGA